MYFSFITEPNATDTSKSYYKTNSIIEIVCLLINPKLYIDNFDSLKLHSSIISLKTNS